MVIRLDNDVVITELIEGMFRRESDMFVTSVSRPEADMRLESGANETIMEGNIVVASGQHRYAEGSTRVGMVWL